MKRLRMRLSLRLPEGSRIRWTSGAKMLALLTLPFSGESLTEVEQTRASLVKDDLVFVEGLTF